jgi:hypothetical protein
MRRSPTLGFVNLFMCTSVGFHPEAPTENTTHMFAPSIPVQFPRSQCCNQHGCPLQAHMEPASTSALRLFQSACKLWYSREGDRTHGVEHSETLRRSLGIARRNAPWIPRKASWPEGDCIGAYPHMYRWLVHPTKVLLACGFISYFPLNAA